jgi:hypothetical protein
MLIETLDETETTLFIESIIGNIDFSYMRQLEAFPERMSVLVSHFIVFEVDFFFFALVIDKPKWDRN